MVSQVVSEPLSTHNIDNSVASLFNSDCAFSVAEVVVPVDFGLHRRDELLQRGNHVVQVIEIVSREFLSLDINSCLEVSDLGSVLISLGIGDVEIGSEPLDFDFEVVVFGPSPVKFISESPDFVLELGDLVAEISDPLVVSLDGILALVDTRLESLFSVPSFGQLGFQVPDQ